MESSTSDEGSEPWGAAPGRAAKSKSRTQARRGEACRSNQGGTVNAIYWEAYKGEHPQRHLANFRGILQADADAGFNKLYEGGAIQEAPCMAHIRRKCFDLMDAYQSPIAIEAVERIAKFYQIEKEIRSRPPEERRLARDTRARPLLQSMRAWLEASLQQLTPESETASAIHYALARWEALVRYLDDGRIELDNLIAERALRPVAGLQSAGAIIFSLVPTTAARGQLLFIV